MVLLLFSLVVREHCLDSTGSLWYLAEIWKIFLDTAALKCPDIQKAFRKDQEDCSERRLETWLLPNS